MTFQRQPRSAREQELLDLARTYLPGGVRNATMSPAHAMVIESGHGARLRDCSGNEYIDYLLGSGPLPLGHAHPAVVAAVRDYPTPSPNSVGIPRSVADEMLVAPFNDLDTTTTIIERHRDELAGVIVEPMQRTIPPKPGFLAGLRDVTRRYGIPLIFDEI